MRTKKKNTNSYSFIQLLIGWGIILFSYIIFRVIFAVFGFTSASVLGIVLAVIPYSLAALYFLTAVYTHNIGYYFLGILLPSVIEKAALYFLGAFLYDINPMNVNSVFEVIASQKPYINLFPQPSARYILEISFWGWEYILGSLFFSTALIFMLNFVSKKHMRLFSHREFTEDRI